MTFRNSTFDGNNATGNGGAGYVEGGVLMMEDCKGVNSMSAGTGGFIYATGTWLLTSLNPVVHVHLKNVSLRDNRAQHGGALGLDSSARATLRGCMFHGNGVFPGGQGGAVKVGAGANLVAVNTVFKRNTADLGGGVEAKSDVTSMPSPRDRGRSSTGRGVLENKHSTDDVSPPPASPPPASV
jgi:hypothetical protein